MLPLAVKSVFYRLILVINMLYKTRKQLKIVRNKCCFLAFEKPRRDWAIKRKVHPFLWF